MRKLPSTILVSGRRAGPQALLILITVATLWASPQARTGTIKARVHLNGKSPGNVVIRMGVDPLCSQINSGKRVLQESVVADASGGLANVFVKLQGSFPSAPVPSEPVVIDQRNCIYQPRVVGARA